jgi:hypothetical protein
MEIYFSNLMNSYNFVSFWRDLAAAMLCNFLQLQLIWGLPEEPVVVLVLYMTVEFPVALVKTLTHELKIKGLNHTTSTRAQSYKTFLSVIY